MSRARTFFKHGLTIFGGSLVATAPFALPLLIPNNERDTLSLEEKQKRGIKMTEQQVRAALIVEAAFKDQGYLFGDVFVKFANPEKHPMQVTASAARNDIHKAVIVEISGDLQADESLYALAGREAAHVLLYHKEASVVSFYATFAALTAAVIAAKKSPLMMSSFAFAGGFLVHKAVNRILELEADLVSAEKLDTARVLSMTLDANDPLPDPDRTIYIDEKLDAAINYFFQDFPTTNKRCSQLNALRVYSDKPKFFNSAERMSRFEEKVEQYSCKI